MATIEDVLTAVAQLGTELRGEIERQGQELRDHIDHTAAMLKADLRSEMRERFDALLPDITSLDVMTRRLENAEQGRREIDEAMLKGMRRFGERIDRVEERVNGLETRLPLKDKEPPAT
jgi:hypothetical protein